MKKRKTTRQVCIISHILLQSTRYSLFFHLFYDLHANKAYWDVFCCFTSCMPLCLRRAVKYQRCPYLLTNGRLARTYAHTHTLTCLCFFSISECRFFSLKFKFLRNALFVIVTRYIKPGAAHRHKILYCVIPDSGTEKNTTLGDSLKN